MIQPSAAAPHPPAPYGMVSDFWGWAALVFFVFASFSFLPSFLSVLLFFFPPLPLSPPSLRSLSLAPWLSLSLSLASPPHTPPTPTERGATHPLSHSLSPSLFLSLPLSGPRHPPPTPTGGGRDITMEPTPGQDDQTHHHPHPQGGEGGRIPYPLGGGAD